MPSARQCVGTAAIIIGLLLGAPALAGATVPTALPPAAALAVSVEPSSGAPLSYFDVHARAGGPTIAGTLRLSNHGAQPIDVALAPVSGLTLDTLGSGYGTSTSSASAAADGASNWVQLSTERVRLAPHTTTLVDVSTSPPRSAASGDYLAGVSIEALDQQATPDAATHGMEIADLRRYAIGVETRIPGPRVPKLKLTSASVDWRPSGLTFYVHAVNAGNAILTGVHGEISITDGNQSVAQMPVGPGTFVTNSNIEIPLLAKLARPRVGTVFSVRAYLKYDSGIARLDTTVRFGHAAAVVAHSYEPQTMPLPAGSGPPSWFGPLLGVLGTLLVFGLWRIFVVGHRRRKNPPSTPGAGIVLGPPPPSPTGIVLHPPPAIRAGRVTTEPISAAELAAPAAGPDL